MAKYRKKPVVIEAFQMTQAARETTVGWPAWLNAAWQKPMEEVGSFFPLASSLVIHTLEGNHVVSTDDWIIHGVKGELYPCKPDIFHATYEAEEKDDQATIAQAALRGEATDG